MTRRRPTGRWQERITHPARAFKHSGANMIVVFMYASTDRGMLQEMKPQHIEPVVLVELTCSSIAETPKSWSEATEDMHILTGLVPFTEDAAMVAAAAEGSFWLPPEQQTDYFAVVRAGLQAHLHS